MAALGQALGVSKPAAAAYLKRDDWPFGAGPWASDRVPQMRQWRADVLRPANVPAEASAPAGGRESVATTVKRLQGLLIKEKIEGEKIENARKRGELVDRSEAESRHLTVLEMLKRDLLAMPNRLPFEDPLKEIVRQHVRQEFERLSRPGPK